MSVLTQEAKALYQGGLTLPEAPRWHDGSLWFSDFFTHRVLRYDPARHAISTVCTLQGRPSGLGFMPDGQLRIVSMDDCRLLSWTGSDLEVVADFSEIVPGPANDMVVTRSGHAYIGNFGLKTTFPQVAVPTRLLRISPDGDIDIAAEDVVFPNGIVVDEDNATLYVAETYRCRISEFHISSDGLTERRVWHAFAPDPGVYDISNITNKLPIIPDGITMDADHCLWIADAKGHGIGRWDQNGELLEFVTTDNLSVYSAVLGGSDGRDLFLTCALPVETCDPSKTVAGAILSARVAVPALGS